MITLVARAGENQIHLAQTRFHWACGIMGVKIIFSHRVVKTAKIFGKKVTLN